MCSTFSETETHRHSPTSSIWWLLRTLFRSILFLTCTGCAKANSDSLVLTGQWECKDGISVFIVRVTSEQFGIGEVVFEKEKKNSLSRHIFLASRNETIETMMPLLPTPTPANSRMGEAQVQVRFLTLRGLISRRIAVPEPPPQITVISDTVNGDSIPIEVASINGAGEVVKKTQARATRNSNGEYSFSFRSCGIASATDAGVSLEHQDTAINRVILDLENTPLLPYDPATSTVNIDPLEFSFKSVKIKPTLGHSGELVQRVDVKFDWRSVAKFAIRDARTSCKASGSRNKILLIKMPQESDQILVTRGTPATLRNICLIGRMTLIEDTDACAYQNGQKVWVYSRGAASEKIDVVATSSSAVIGSFRVQAKKIECPKAISVSEPGYSAHFSNPPEPDRGPLFRWLEESILR